MKIFARNAHALPANNPLALSLRLWQTPMFWPHHHSNHPHIPQPPTSKQKLFIESLRIIRHASARIAPRIQTYICTSIVRAFTVFGRFAGILVKMEFQCFICLRAANNSVRTPSTPHHQIIAPQYILRQIWRRLIFMKSFDSHVQHACSMRVLVTRN